MKCEDARHHLLELEIDEAAVPHSVAAATHIHVRACPECGALAEQEKHLLAAIKRIPPETTSVNFTADVMSRVRVLASQELRPLPQRPRRVDRWWVKPSFLLQTLAAAASVVLVLTPAGRALGAGIWGLLRSGSGGTTVAGTPPVAVELDRALNIAGKIQAFDVVWVILAVAGIWTINWIMRRKGN
ncbi:MAG: hypothetical protein K1Y36_30350 [Blastocatellia bacterium]|nr:hypothetical protein [Blastocatellia bacterium]